MSALELLKRRATCFLLGHVFTHSRVQCARCQYLDGTQIMGPFS